MPEVTIVIAHHDAWTYLPKAIACAKAQTVPVDIIVIDDLSPQWRVYLQESPAELWEGVTFVHTPRKLNWGPTLNLGFQYSQTPWVVPLNGDDLIAPNMVEECLKVADKDTVIVVPQPGKWDNSIYEENTLPYCAMIRPTFSYKRWETTLEYIDHPLADWNLWCSLRLSYKDQLPIKFTDQSLFTWVDRPGSVTRTLGASGELEKLVKEFKEKWAKR